LKEDLKFDQPGGSTVTVAEWMNPGEVKMSDDGFDDCVNRL
jgi:hypothetical protein